MGFERNVRCSNQFRNAQVAVALGGEVHLPNDTFDTQAFRKALGAYLTGVTIVAICEADDTPRGFTANSFTSVSLDPPLVLVCIAKNSTSCSAFSSCERFGISVLSENQQEVSSIFASKGTDRFGRVRWYKSPLGSPLISDASS